MGETEENILSVLSQHEEIKRPVAIDYRFADEGGYWVVDEETGEPLFSVQMMK